MKKITTVFLGCTLSLLSVAQQLSIKQAVSLALQNRFELQQADLQAELASNNVRKAETAFLPQINAVLDAKYNTQLQTSVIPANAFGGTGSGDRFVQFGTPYNTSFGIALKENIIDPLAIGERKIARQQTAVSILDKEATRIQITEKVMQEYIKASLANATCELARLRLENAITQYNYQKNKVEQKQALETDVKKAELDKQIAENQVVNSIRDSVLAIQSLAYECGLPWGANLSLSQNLEELLTELDAEELPTSPDSRIEWRQENLRKSIIQSQIRKISFSYLPGVSLLANYAVQQFSRNYNPFEGNYWFPVSYVGFQMNLPIFDALQRERNRSEFKLQNIISDLRLQQIRRLVDFELQSLTQQSKQAELNLLQAKANLQFAQDLCQLALERKNKGILLPSELSQNLFTMQEAKYQCKQAQYNLLLHHIQLLRAKSAL